MNKEIYYEGWLIKSPPTKRIWRARWRRRWFTLKQGEIPEQFCLEYYADRKCRKLKGVIDLDQCEQVDCGLRLENRKQKFQFMFDIKTPKRTYYLAADTETDMRDWVNCICQVCHLHDTKQSQDDNRNQNNAATTHTNSSNDTTTTTINSSSGTNASNTRQSFNNDILRRPLNVVEQQPLTAATTNANLTNASSSTSSTSYQHSNDSAYVNTEYTNRETLLCDAQFEKQQLVNVAANAQHTAPSNTSSAALYLNTAAFQDTSRLSVSSNGVVRKIPENLVLNNTPLPESQQHSVQPSPALSTASGPYIPISECYSGSPKFMLDNENPSTPLNNLDPKFYDTPRSHNNIGLNLTNDQSYSPKITNCGTVQQPINVSKNRSQKSDSDSESVFTDDDEWAHPMPLRENMDRNTRPSDSSVENESFVLTYSQRFSKLPDDVKKEQQGMTTQNSNDCLEKLAKVLKNKNNLILDFKENEKLTRDLPQFSDTENTSPAIIGPRDARSVVEESYDIPRSHQLPYYNMAHLLEKVISPEANPIAASTPNLMAGLDTMPGSPSSVISVAHSLGPQSSTNMRTLPRPHCYTNAAPSKIEGNVFRYDFIEQTNLPPVNRKLKPKLSIEADKPPEELPAKPPQLAVQQVDNLANRLHNTQIQAPAGLVGSENIPLKPPSVDRKNKPNAYKIGNSNTLGNNTRRTTGAPLSMVLPNDAETSNTSYLMETRTLPRQPRPNYAFNTSNASLCNTPTAVNAPPTVFSIQHQRTASANAAMQQLSNATNAIPPQIQPPPKNEHKLQYFDLDVANAPAINRQSMSVGNLNNPGVGRLGLAADPSARAPVQSTVVYNSVDFVKTEAFKRIREERKKENEGVNANK
ncbi:Protein daughter of sevenless [Lucilia cuprina]|uniref:Protein daughter of sevenless n=1 Tax=Lucilia cuprina TaxID=7375 RepID=A0A0L0CDA8_LUCCU|nr:Protein daughter of sevenless [Lucilia cuprina]KNC30378.1 Protein daughter of sevenless [Lucilia cuprina]